MRAEWHNINDPGFSFAQEEEPKKAQTEEQPEEAPGSVQLSGPTIIAGKDGLDFNKTCTLRVSAGVSGNVPNKNVVFKLFSSYKGKEEDMKAGGSGSISKDGAAECTVTLFTNSAYYDDTGKDDSTTVDYYFTAEHRQAEQSVKSATCAVPALSAKDSAKQAAKSDMNKEAAQSGAACTSDCTTCAKKDSCQGEGEE